MTAPLPTIDLNADLGEGCPNDEPLLRRVTSASISCGAHAGARETILRALSIALRNGVSVGAHPGFPDRAQFGRRERPLTSRDATALILEQVESLQAMARAVGIGLRFVKPHGALYNQAQREVEAAQGIVDALLKLRLPVLGQPGSLMEQAARAAGVPFVAEGFPERRYTPEGRLVARSEPNAVLHDPAEIGAQALRLVSQGVQTLCIHGDDVAAVEKADTVLSALKRGGVVVRSFVP